MARAKLRTRHFVIIDDKEVLYMEKDIDGNVIWHLPKEQFRQYENKMMANVSRGMSEYVNNNPDCALLNA